MRHDGCTCGKRAISEHLPGCTVRPITLPTHRKAGSASEEAATRIAGLEPVDPRIARLLRVEAAAKNMRAHIEGGMEDGSHLPGDLCFTQLQRALDL